MRTLNLDNKKVLVRVDFNVPLDESYNVSDNTRIVRAIPTIQYILDKGGSVILMSHLGRPLRKRNEDGSINRKAFTLKHLTNELSELLNRPVHFASDTIGDEARRLAGNLSPGEILLLENTRFHEEETSGDVEFAKELSQLGDVYINDAFGTAHRSHASTAVIAQFFDQTQRGFGFLIENELRNASKILVNPPGPFTAILGGAKVSDKIALIENLLPKVDNICIGGGMAYTFIKALGGKVGNSLVEDERIEMASDLLRKAEKSNTAIHLPEDSLIASDFSNDARSKEVMSDQIENGWMGLDIGNRAISKFRKVILESRTIIWNGPMGVFEFPSFSNGTIEVAKAMALATETGAFSLVGGGDSIAAINQSGLSDKVSFISTGGGAMLELLEGKSLPGIAAIEEE